MFGVDAVVPTLVMIRPTPVRMMIDGVVYLERGHTLREEWVLFASPDGARPCLAPSKARLPHRAIANRPSLITNHPVPLNLSPLYSSRATIGTAEVLGYHRIMADLERRDALDMAELRTGRYRAVGVRGAYPYFRDPKGGGR